MWNINQSLIFLQNERIITINLSEMPQTDNFFQYISS